MCVCVCIYLSVLVKITTVRDSKAQHYVFSLIDPTQYNLKFCHCFV
jgi:hypothetical protein